MSQKLKKKAANLCPYLCQILKYWPIFKKVTGTFSEKFVISGEVYHKSIANCLLGITVKESVKSVNIC